MVWVVAHEEYKNSQGVDCMTSLNIKYRPQILDDVVGQDSVIKVLKKQVETGNIKHAYLFCGQSGGGKTTTARSFARAINNGQGTPIEIDAASNNGVENMRNLVRESNERSIDSKYKTIIIDECVTGDTEILTDEGFKRIDSLSKKEKIAQYNDFGIISFVSPTEYIEKDYSGTMYRVSIGTKAEFYMSPNHVQPLYYTQSGKVREKYIKDTKFSYGNKLIVSGYGSGNEHKLTAIDIIAIILQADGALQHENKDNNYWVLNVKDRSKLNRIRVLLSVSGLEYKEISAEEEYVRFAIHTPKTITKLFSTHFSLPNMSYDYAREFIDEVMIWDGHHPMDSKYYYYSSSDKENVDFCQAVAILGGFSAREVLSHDSRGEKYKDSYRLYMQKRFYSNGNQYVYKNEVEFNGKIYCVKVPRHKIIIRRDGMTIITGNCHNLTGAAVQPLLKCLEEPPEYTIFILCTTDPQKLPETILNRVQRFNFNRIPTNLIYDRLKYVCDSENFTNYEESIDYISRIADGCMRAALTYLDKVADFSTDFNIQDTLRILSVFSYDIYFDLVNYMLDDREVDVLNLIDNVYDNGMDVKLFVKQFLKFVLDVSKYILFNTTEVTNIPKSYEKRLQEISNFDNPMSYYNYLIDKVLELNNMQSVDITTLEVVCLQISRMK